MHQGRFQCYCKLGVLQYMWVVHSLFRFFRNITTLFNIGSIRMVNVDLALCNEYEINIYISC